MKYILLITLFLSAGIFLTGYFLGQPTQQRNYNVLPDMYYPVTYETQSANPVFPDGKTQQVPPSGTIARDHLPLHYDASKSSAQRAAQKLVMPIDSLARSDLQRGEEVYKTFCSPCHGVGGQGDGRVARRGFPRPPSLFLNSALQMPDGQIFHVISYGQNTMPGYNGQISRIDRWRTVAYIRELQTQNQQDTIHAG